jgi:hypothetical protein
MTTFVKWELHFISSMTHIISIRVNKITVLCRIGHFHSRMCNLTEKCMIINTRVSYSIKNSMQQFITYACFVSKHSASHVTLIHGVLRDWYPGNGVATSAYHHAQFISQENVHSYTTWCCYWNVWGALLSWHYTWKHVYRGIFSKRACNSFCKNLA